VARTDLLNSMVPSLNESANAGNRLQGSLQRAVPRLTQYGGFKRLGVSLPEPATGNRFSDRLHEELKATATLLQGQPNEVTICYEQAGISLAHAAVGIINRRYDYAKLAARAHTRCDVFWAPLTNSPCVPPELKSEEPKTLGAIASPAPISHTTDSPSHCGS
jgi:hypothetical protein